MVLAGMATYPVYINNNYDENSVTSYLRSNANDYYWTLSPVDFDGDATAAFSVSVTPETDVITKTAKTVEVEVTPVAKG